MRADIRSANRTYLTSRGGGIRRRHGFGFDLGHRFMKVVHVEESLEGMTVRAAAAVPVPADCFDGDRIVDRRRLSSLLRSLCREQGIAPSRGRFCVPTSALSLKWIDIPPIAPEDYQDVAKMQCRRYFGVDPDTTYQTLVPLSSSKSSTEASYLLVAAPKDVVEDRARVMEAANIEPVAADIEPFCILRAFRNLFTRGGVFWRSQPLTFVEIGAVTTRMYVVRDMALQFVRSISFGGRDLALHVAQELGVSDTKAFELIESPTCSVDASGVLRVSSAALDSSSRLAQAKRNSSESSSPASSVNLLLVSNDEASGTTASEVIGTSNGVHDTDSEIDATDNKVRRPNDGMQGANDDTLTPASVSHTRTGANLPGQRSEIVSSSVSSVSMEPELSVLQVSEVFKPFAREISRLLVYYRSLYPERSYVGILDRLYLCGGMSSLKGMDAFVASLLGVSVHTPNPFAQALAKFNMKAFESVSHKEQAFSAAIGLAAADLSGAPLTEEGSRNSDGDGFVWSRTA